MEDLIKRSDAINAINDVGWLEDAEYEERILAIPTIEPKRGEWLERNSGFIKWIRCSACNHRIYQGTKTNFCPNCGADMREREGE